MRERLSGLSLLLAVIAFFIPGVSEFFLKEISIPIGSLPLILILGWLVLVRHKQVTTHEGVGKGLSQGQHTDTRLVPKYKNETIDFPNEKIRYSLRYPVNEQDIAGSLGISLPRCLEHPVVMEENRNRYSEIGFTCAACGRSLSRKENNRLQVLAQTQLLKKLGR